jgi:hypothetical protein
MGLDFHGKACGNKNSDLTSTRYKGISTKAIPSALDLGPDPQQPPKPGAGLPERILQ